MGLHRFTDSRRPRGVVGVLIAFALGVGMLSACDDGASPEPSPDTSSSAEGDTPEPTADYTIPPRPLDVRKPEEPELTAIDIDNAYELARYYLDLYPYVKATGDTADWEKYAHPECEYCATVIDSAVASNEVGAWSDFNLGVADVATFSATGDVDFRVDFLVDRDEIVYYGPDGEVRTDPAEHSVVIGIKEVDGKLLVRSFDILVPEMFGEKDL